MLDIHGLDYDSCGCEVWLSLLFFFSLPPQAFEVIVFSFRKDFYPAILMFVSLQDTFILPVGIEK